MSHRVTAEATAVAGDAQAASEAVGLRRLRVFIVSFVFPPFNVIGAVRVGKTAKYLHRLGHDVRVIAASGQTDPPTLPLEIPQDKVVYVPWTDRDAAYQAILSLRGRINDWIHRGRRKPTGIGPALLHSQPVDVHAARGSAFGTLARLAYSDILHFPDSAAGWRRPATQTGRVMLKQWKPDVILASGAPWTSLVVARDLAQHARVPWVADLRDPWTRNPDLPVSAVRRRVVDPWYSRHVLASAASLVTVSEPLAAALRREHPEKRVDVVLNGYDPDDYQPSGRNGSTELLDSTSPRPRGPSGETLRLVYTGQIYRNMTPLLDGIALLGPDARWICVDLFGVMDEPTRRRYSALAAERAIGDQIRWRDAVPHGVAARIQQSADVLFLLIHNTAYDSGIYTGKLLEYIGARRPILIVGTSSGVAAELVRERKLGVAEETPEAIAARLREWLNEKRHNGVVLGPLEASIQDLSREAQTRVFSDILERAVADR